MLGRKPEPDKSGSQAVLATESDTNVRAFARLIARSTPRNHIFAEVYKPKPRSQSSKMMLPKNGSNRG